MKVFLASRGGVVIGLGMTVVACATPLCSAAASGDLASTRALLAQGASPNERCVAKSTPLHYAAYYGKSAVADLLIEKGADINAVDINNSTALHVAVGTRNARMVELLVGAGADTTIVAEHGAGTALKVAESQGDATVAKILREARPATRSRASPFPPASASEATAKPAQAAPLHARALVMELKAVGATPPRLASVITRLLLARLDEVEGLRTVSPEDLQLMLSIEKQKDALGCDDIKCIAEIGGALGTDFVVYGQVAVVGSQYSLNLTAIEARRSQAVARVSALVALSEDALVQAVPAAVLSLVAKMQRQ